MQINRISADEAHAARKQHLRMGSDGSELLLKAANAPTSWNSSNRSVRMVMTKQIKDHYGDIVVTAGVNTDVFDTNPKAYFNHRSGDWPIGNWANVEKVLRGRPPRMEGDLVLLPANGPVPQVDMAAWMVEHGGLQGCSIGFLPKWDSVEKVVEEDGSWNGGLQFNESTLMEASLCGLPANPDCLAKSLSADILIAHEALEFALDTWARSPDGKLIAREEFDKTYRLVKLVGSDAGVINELLDHMADQEVLALCEKRIVASGKVIVEQSRVEAIERAAKQKRLDEKRLREKTIREEKIELLKKSG